MKANRPAESRIPVGGGNAACAAANVAIAANVSIAALAVEAGAAAFCAASFAADALTASGLSSKAEVLAQCADIVRNWFPAAPQDAIYFLMGINS